MADRDDDDDDDGEVMGSDVNPVKSGLVDVAFLFSKLFVFLYVCNVKVSECVCVCKRLNIG